MPDKEGIANEFDGPWKVALEIYLRPFLQLCFPDVHDLIEWNYPPEFLDTELPALGPAHQQGLLAVDRLVKVRLLDGQFEWLFIHVEIQAQRQGQFPLRLFVYHYRIWDRFGHRVVSLAVLADDDPTWHPNVHETVTAACRLRFEFPVFKVKSFMDPEGYFARTGNPFALVIAAHQLALATAGDPETRYRRRFQLLRRLSEHGMNRQQARELWKVIHVLTRLPKDLELKFRAETTNVPPMSIKDLITPLEEIALAEGEARGEVRGATCAILDALAARFGPIAPETVARLEAINELENLRSILRRAVTEPSLESFLAKLAP